MKMRGRPLMFSAPMVQALLNGTKTQTRRIISPQPQGMYRRDWDLWSNPWPWLSIAGRDVLCPKGYPPDLLWVRETWMLLYDAGDGTLTQNGVGRSRPTATTSDSSRPRSRSSPSSDRGRRCGSSRPRLSSRTAGALSLRSGRFSRGSSHDRQRPDASPRHAAPDGSRGEGVCRLAGQRIFLFLANHGWTEPVPTVVRGMAYLRSVVRTPAPAPGLEVLHAETQRLVSHGDVAAERQRQIEVEGWTPEHDDKHDDGSLARAASCYADVRSAVPPQAWPWSAKAWKPKKRRRNLVIAAALLIAEIERLDRRKP